MKKRNLFSWLCLLGALALLFLGLTTHWLYWIAMVFLILAAFLMKK